MEKDLNSRFELKPEEFLGQNNINFYLHDVISQLLEIRTDHPLHFIAH